MPRGGKRPGAGRPATWKTGPADTAIKIPAALVERVMAYARELDAQVIENGTESNAVDDGGKLLGEKDRG